MPFALFYAIEPNADRARLIARTGLEAHSAAAPAWIDLQAASDTGWPIASALAQENATALFDLQTRFGRLTSDPYPEAVLVPVGQRGVDHKPYGVLIAGVNPRRLLDDAYRGFFDLASEHIAGAVSEALEREEREWLVARERAADARLRLLFNEAPAAIALLRGPELIFELANPQYRRLVGRDDLLGRAGREALPELGEQGVWDLFDRVYRTGEPFIGREYEAKLDRLGNGTLELGARQSMKASAGTPKGGSIQVVLKRVESMLKLAVIDSGCGITPAFLPHVFDRFRQADGSRRTGGARGARVLYGLL